MKQLILAFFLSITGLLFAQNGTVKSYHKISQTVGNFPITFNQGFGRSSACISDFNNDGIKDIVVSSVIGNYDGQLFISLLNSNGTVKSAVEIKRGVSGLPSTMPNLDIDMDYFGWSVDTIGDLNNDGVIDLIVGIPRMQGGNGRGHVMVLFMNNNGTVNSFKIIGQNDGGFNDNLDNTLFGYSVAGIGDINNDGVLDIAVGGMESHNDKGAVWILFLNNDGSVKSFKRLDETNTYIQSYFNQSTTQWYRMGYSLSLIGDLNKDGINDLLVGCNSYRTQNTYGSAVILFLKADGTIKGTKAIDQSAAYFPDTLINYYDTLNPLIHTEYGNSVTAIGDINGDFVTDIAISAPEFTDTNCTNCGAVGIFMLDTLGNIIDYQRISNTIGGFTNVLSTADGFGFSISGIGDFNGDQINDIIVSAIGDDDGGFGKGAIYILNLNGVPDTSPIKNVNQLSGVKLFPNPTTESIRIEFKSTLSQETLWKIQDLKGVMLKSGEIPINSLSENINIQDLSSGIYIITFQNRNNVFTKKIIIAR